MKTRLNNDLWIWWRNALSGDFGPIYENDPQIGFYRVRSSKRGEFIPVAIWHEEGALVATKGHDNIDPYEIWTYACRNPITYELYESVMSGEPWPHEIRDDEIQPSISNNALEHELIGDEIDAIVSAFKNWFESIGGVIGTSEQSDKAATYTERVANIEKRALAAHKAEKEPFLNGGRKVDAKWKPLSEKADSIKRSIKTAIGEYLIAENKRRILEAEKVNSNSPATVQATSVKTGGSARAVSLRTRKTARINDLKAASAHIASMANPPKEFVELVRKLAEKQLLAGLAVRGAEIIEEQIAA